MENRKKYAKSILFRCLACVLAVLVVAVGAWGVKSVSAKYVKSYTLQGSVYIETENNAEILLYEHKAYPQSNGEYLLDVDAAEVTANEYTLLPGVDVPKDPCIYIKSLETASYIYIEVVNTLGEDSAVTYQLESCWVQVEGATGLNGGTVYVYSADGTNPTLVTVTADTEASSSFTKTDQTTSAEATTADPEYKMTLNILTNQSVAVGEALGTDLTGGMLVFYGYVASASENDSAVDIFNSTFASAESDSTTE